MAFINKQEEVIQLKITPFGRQLLSKGRFKPVYYAFFDDGILYDGAHAGLVEEQNEIQDRIKSGLRLDLQQTTMGIETAYLKETEEIRKGEKDLFEPANSMQDQAEKDRLLSNILGMASYETTNAPSYNIKSLEGARFTGSVTFLTSSHNASIPQITLESRYEININRKSTKTPIQDFETQVDVMSENIEFLDGTFLKTDKEVITLQILEDNVNLLKEMFEIEIYEITETTGSNGQTQERLVKVENVDNYFNIKTDKQVTNYNKIQKDLRRGLFVGGQ